MLRAVLQPSAHYCVSTPRRDNSCSACRWCTSQTPTGPLQCPQPLKPGDALCTILCCLRGSASSTETSSQTTCYAQLTVCGTLSCPIAHLRLSRGLALGAMSVSRLRIADFGWCCRREDSPTCLAPPSDYSAFLVCRLRPF